MRSRLLLIPLLALVLFPSARAQTPEPLAQWSFSREEKSTPHTTRSAALAALEGNVQYVPGISGDGLRFDGYTTSMTVRSGDVPQLNPAGFTVQAWVALDTYPWNWLPIVAQETQHQAGFFLGLDAFGHVAFEASVDGQWRSAISTATVPLQQWALLAGTYASDHGKGTLTVLLNGVPLETVNVFGEYTPSHADLLLGRTPQPILPFPEAEVKPPQPIVYSLDGILDEVRIYGYARTPAELTQEASASNIPRGDVLPRQTMPSGPPGPARFGAFYTTLHYEDTWERLRQVGPDADVVVRFDSSPSRLVFWQGTNYVPTWVSADNKWYTDEFVEVWNSGCPDKGDCEPMSDKQARFSHVDILESNDARAVVHWRYALTEVVNGKGAWPDPRRNWFDWADEYWTVYPDGVAIRKQVLHSSNVNAVREWQETIVLHQPGRSPEDDIDRAAITLGNLQGATKTYTWREHPAHSFSDPPGPGEFSGPPQPNMQMVNLKSSWKPFQIVPPEGASADFYNNERSYFTFECWNHWPVAQIASSDRPCVTTDRPSHSSLSHLFWNTSSRTEDTATKLLMDGLTAENLADLLPLAKSWITPPPLQVTEGPVRNEGYDASQRAYILSANSPDHPAPLHLTLEASDASPLAHAALLVKNWGDDDLRVMIDGRPAPTGHTPRVAHLQHLDRTDLLLWIEQDSTRPIHLTLLPIPHKSQ